MNQNTKLHNQQKLLLALLCISTLTALLLWLPKPNANAKFEDVLRLHVIAASNSEEDQTAKYTLAEAILPQITTLTASCQSVSEAQNLLVQHQEEITAFATRILKNMGYSKGVLVEIGEFRYDRRNLNGKIYPAGAYPSFRLVIGEGKGQNCWSVLFPTTALYISSDGGSEVLTSPTYSFSRDNVSLRFKSVDWLLALLKTN